MATHSRTDTRGDQVAGRVEERVPYDLLVLAMGAHSATFGIVGVTSESVHFLKQLDDARRIRRHVLSNFETAAFHDLTDAERRELLSFVIVGGGPTGVEFAAGAFRVPPAQAPLEQRTCTAPAPQSCTTSSTKTWQSSTPRTSWMLSPSSCWKGTKSWVRAARLQRSGSNASLAPPSRATRPPPTPSCRRQL